MKPLDVGPASRGATIARGAAVDASRGGRHSDDAADDYLPPLKRPAAEMALSTASLALSKE